MVKIIWTKRAFAQFERAIKYIREEQGLTYATIVYDKIIESISRLQHHPLIGSSEPALAHKSLNIITWLYGATRLFTE